jgi:hypothetical protein
MKRKAPFAVLTAVVATVLMAGCGSSTRTIPPVGQTGEVSVSITDAPPAGVTILSFEVSVTGASLMPGNVDLLNGKGPFEVEVQRLNTDTTYLITSSVAAANYTSLTLTFANPEVTFQNNTNSTLAGCAPGAVCEFSPGGTLTTTVTGTFDIASASETGLLIDVNLNSLFSSTMSVDFSTSGTVTTTVQTAQAGGGLETVDVVDGIVTATTSTQYTLQTVDLGTITVIVDSNTQFTDFGSCKASNLTCVAVGQSVEVSLTLMPGGTFLATSVDLQDDVTTAADDELEGTIFKIDSSTQFEMVVTDELRAVTNVSIGDPVIVVLQTAGSGTTFIVDTDGLTVPSNLQQTFDGATDTSQLMAGQSVQVLKSSITGGPIPAAITITTDRVRLRRSHLDATVSGAPSGNSFNAVGLSSLFTITGTNQIQVQTSSQTDFENVSGISGITSGAAVSLRGWLFKSAPTPVLTADVVREP